MAKRISGGKAGLMDDLVQEGMLALLELNARDNEPLRKDQMSFVCQRLGECRNSLIDRLSPISLHDKRGLDGEVLDIAVAVDRGRMAVPAHMAKGPRKPPKDKYARFRHKAYFSGRCYRCNRTLPDRQFTRCLICRAKRSWMLRAKSKNTKRRKRSQYDPVIALLGLDLSLAKETGPRYMQPEDVD